MVVKICLLTPFVGKEQEVLELKHVVPRRVIGG